MYETNSNPTFEARRLKSASGWYVRVGWPNGKLDHIPGFVSQEEAQRWIEEKAPAWLSESGSALGASFARFVNVHASAPNARPNWRERRA
jgi:hypothetical protein